eukprot:COSAG01_NODE_3663_length_5815_cov_10.892932_4_plen_1069_part_00
MASQLPAEEDLPSPTPEEDEEGQALAAAAPAAPALRFEVVAKAALTSSVELGSSRKVIRSLSPGTIISALERRIDSGGLVRLRTPEGWVSMVSPSGQVLLRFHNLTGLAASPAAATAAAGAGARRRGRGGQPARSSSALGPRGRSGPTEGGDSSDFEYQEVSDVSDDSEEDGAMWTTTAAPFAFNATEAAADEREPPRRPPQTSLVRYYAAGEGPPAEAPPLLSQAQLQARVEAEAQDGERYLRTRQDYRRRRSHRRRARASRGGSPTAGPSPDKKKQGRAARGSASPQFHRDRGLARETFIAGEVRRANDAEEDARKEESQRKVPDRKPERPHQPGKSVVWDHLGEGKVTGDTKPGLQVKAPHVSRGHAYDIETWQAAQDAKGRKRDESRAAREAQELPARPATRGFAAASAGSPALTKVSARRSAGWGEEDSGAVAFHDRIMKHPEVVRKALHQKKKDAEAQWFSPKVNTHKHPKVVAKVDHRSPARSPGSPQTPLAQTGRRSSRRSPLKLTQPFPLRSKLASPGGNASPTDVTRATGSASPTDPFTRPPSCLKAGALPAYTHHRNDAQMLGPQGKPPPKLSPGSQRLLKSWHPSFAADSTAAAERGIHSSLFGLHGQKLASPESPVSPLLESESEPELEVLDFTLEPEGVPPTLTERRKALGYLPTGHGAPSAGMCTAAEHKQLVTLRRHMQRCGLESWYGHISMHLGVRTVGQLRAMKATDLRRMAEAAHMRLDVETIRQVLAAVHIPISPAEKYAAFASASHGGAVSATARFVALQRVYDFSGTATQFTTKLEPEPEPEVEAEPEPEPEPESQQQLEQESDQDKQEAARQRLRQRRDPLCHAIRAMSSERAVVSTAETDVEAARQGMRRGEAAVQAHVLRGDQARAKDIFRADPVESAMLRERRFDLMIPDKKCRSELFQRIDAGGSGFLTLAQVDKFVREVYPSMDNKQALLRAFAAADRNGDKLIERAEFKLLLHGLVYFHRLGHLFDAVGSSHNHRLDRGHFSDVRATPDGLCWFVCPACLSMWVLVCRLVASLGSPWHPAKKAPSLSGSVIGVPTRMCC